MQAAREEPEPIAADQAGIDVLEPEGDTLYFGASLTGTEVALGRLNLNNQAVLILAREPLANFASLALVPDGLLFIADDAGGTAGKASVFLAGREPGDAELLATHAGQPVPGSLTVLGSYAYYLMYPTQVGTGQQLYRVRIGGSGDVDAGVGDAGVDAGIGDAGLAGIGEAEALGVRTLGLSDLATDGRRLFAALSNDQDELGNPPERQGIAQVSTADGTLELVQAVDELDYGTLVADGTDLYFGGKRGEVRGVFRVAGDARPELLVEVGSQTEGLALDASAVYFVRSCEGVANVLRLAKP